MANNIMSKQQGFLRDRGGVAAVEFALVLPVMIVLYFGSVEITTILQADRKVTSVASTVADLIAQAEIIDDDAMQDVFLAADSIMVPFKPTDVTIVVSSIYEDNGTARVDWSDGLRKQPRAEDSTVELPDGLLPTGSTIIMAEVTFTYTSPFGQFLTNGISVDDQFYLRPRRVVQVPRVP